MDDYGETTAKKRAEMLAGLSRAIDVYAEFVSDPARHSEHDARLLAIMLAEFNRLSGWIARSAAQAIETGTAETLAAPGEA